MKRFCCEKKTTSYQFLAKMKKWKNETYVISAPCKKGKINKRNFIISAPGPLAKEKKKNLVTLEKKKRRRKNLRHIRPQTPLNCNCNFSPTAFQLCYNDHNYSTPQQTLNHRIIKATL